MRVIKRNGAEVEFDIVKIIAAVTKANDVVDEEARMTPVQIQRIAESVEFSCQSLGRAPTVEEIQDFVEHQIMAHGAFEVAKRYITYRYNRSLVRKSNTTDDKILSLIECNNEEAKQENSNKNPVVNSTQRDYMAGEVSRDLTNRLLLPEDIVKAHEEGIIHFHDTDYYAQHMHNCDLVNLEDMLQNGTVITGTLIERPHSFATACNIATQIVAQVASNQYGGQSISLTHLAPFVDVSRQKIRKQVLAEVDPNATYPRLSMSDSKNRVTSSFWMQDASYAKLRNLQVGYSLPKQLISKYGISRLRVYCSIDNLFMISGFDGVDPEAISGNYYPLTRNYSFGLNITF